MGTSANYSASSILQKQQGPCWKPARAAWSAPQLQKFLLRGSHWERGWTPVRGGAVGLKPGNQASRGMSIGLSGSLSSLSAFFSLFPPFSSPDLSFASFIYNLLIFFSASFSFSFLLPSFFSTFLLAFFPSELSWLECFCMTHYVVLQKKKKKKPTKCLHEINKMNHSCTYVCSKGVYLLTKWEITVGFKCKVLRSRVLGAGNLGHQLTTAKVALFVTFILNPHAKAYGPRVSPP